jgi:hypothetical protein
VAPSVLEDFFKPHVVRARSPRKMSGAMFRSSMNTRHGFSPITSPSTPFDYGSNHRDDPMDTSTPKCF